MTEKLISFISEEVNNKPLFCSVIGRIQLSDTPVVRDIVIYRTIIADKHREPSISQFFESDVTNTFKSVRKNVGHVGFLIGLQIIRFRKATSHAKSNDSDEDEGNDFFHINLLLLI